MRKPPHNPHDLGRHDLDDRQEVNWRAIAGLLRHLGYDGLKLTAESLLAFQRDFAHFSVRPRMTTWYMISFIAPSVMIDEMMRDLAVGGRPEGRPLTRSRAGWRLETPDRLHSDQHPR